LIQSNREFILELVIYTKRWARFDFVGLVKSQDISLQNFSSYLTETRYSAPPGPWFEPWRWKHQLIGTWKNHHPLDDFSMYLYNRKMAHNRKRYIRKHILDALCFAPIVGVLGQRQVGKTTLVEEIVGDQYATFDDEFTLERAESSPSRFLESFSKLAAIDECQKSSSIFSALKLRVQKNKRPGQFLLTGSIRFTSRKAIQESLTGRIHLIEMLPLSIAEMNHLNSEDIMKWPKKSLVDLKSHFKERAKKVKGFDTHLAKGGLPGICFLRKESHRSAKFKSHIETLLRRDLRLIIETTVPFASLQSLLRFLANRQGLPFRLSDASRDAKISPNTLNKLIDAFENMFLIRRVPGIGFTRGDIFYFEDQGMASYLNRYTLESDLQRLAFSQLFSHVHSTNMNEFEVFHFDTKAGARVPLVFRVRDSYLGFITTSDTAPSLKAVRSAGAFLNAYPGASVFILSRTKEFEVIDKGIWSMPIEFIA